MYKQALSNLCMPLMEYVSLFVIYYLLIHINNIRGKRMSFPIKTFTTVSIEKSRSCKTEAIKIRKNLVII